MSVHPYPLDPTSTALRLEWPHLPPRVRDAVEARCGAPVLEAESRDAGFTNGVASVLTCADGSRHFLKAASTKAQRAIAVAYAEEAARLATLPAGTPAPGLTWTGTVEDWVVVLSHHVDGETPARPWRVEDVEACLDALERVTATSVSASLDLATFADEMAAWPQAWADVPVPSHPEHRAEAADLAAGFAAHTAGDALVHTDAQADNWLLGTDGGAVLCDWKWPVRGAAWLDAYLLLASAYGDGVDVNAVIADRPALRDVPDEAVDSLLALAAGYFLRAGCGSVPPNSPHVRDHQYWTGTVCWLWLAARRRW